MFKRLLAIATVLCVVFIPKPTISRAQENLILELRAGFDEFYKVNAWTPIQVSITNQGADLQAQLRVSDDYAGFGSSEVSYLFPIDLPSQSSKQFTLHAPLRGQSQIAVELIDGQGQLLLAERRHVSGLGEDGFLVGVVASDPSLLNGLAKFATEEQKIAVAHLNPEDLPANPQAWNGLDTLVINDIDTSRLTTDQAAAMQNWVRSGGRLLVGGGPNAAQTIAGLNFLLPFSAINIETLQHPIMALEPSASPILPDRGPYMAAVPVNPAGDVLAEEGQQPLIVNLDRGLGQVTYLALDLSLAPFDQLVDRPDIVPQLVGLYQPQQDAFIQKVNKNEIRNSLAIIPDQVLPSPGAIAGYLIIYILIIGPANYFVLTRLKRREWAWITIPIIILLFTGYSYFNSFRLRGGRPLVRQITVIEIDTDLSLADLVSYIGIYSPNRADYTLQIDSRVLVESLPDAYGLNSPLTVISGNATTIENLRGDIGGLPAIIAYDHTPSPELTASLTYDPASSRIQGNITNNTGQPVSDVLLVSADRILSLSTLPPGNSPIDQHLSTRNYYDNFYRELDSQYTGYFGSSSQNSRELLRLASRDTAIWAFFGNNYNPQAAQEAPDNNLVLIGWQDGSQLDVTVAGINTDKLDETLLLVHLPSLAIQ